MGNHRENLVSINSTSTNRSDRNTVSVQSLGSSVSINSTSTNRSDKGHQQITQENRLKFPLIPLLRIEATNYLHSSSVRNPDLRFPLIPLLRIEATEVAIGDKLYCLVNGIEFPLIPLLRIEATESKRDQLIRLGLFPLIPLLRIEATWGDDQSTEELLNLGFH